MELADKIIVITGGANGIGKALALRFDRAGARHIVVADRDAAGAKAVADAVGGTSMETDVGDEAAIARLIETTETTIGPIDLFCSNAGIAAADSLDSPNDEWQLIWDVNVMAHVYAARHLVPRMVARGGGYLMNTASAAGLLNQIGGVVAAAANDGMIEADVLAEAVVEGLREERFLILPHPEVEEYMRRKTADYDRWIRGMNRFHQSLYAAD